LTTVSVCPPLSFPHLLSTIDLFPEYANEWSREWRITFHLIALKRAGKLQVMVDCPHLSRSVCIAQLDLEQLKRFRCGNGEVHKQKRSSNSHSNSALQTRNLLILKKKYDVSFAAEEGNWNCVECGTSQCPWLCLSCGLIHCGRYVNQDGLKHYRTYPGHSICMDCHSYSVFCYQCDDFVGCDTDDHKIASVRSSLEFYNCSRSEDHSYSSAKYESVPEPEEIIEISATDSPPIFCDDDVGEERRKAERAKQTFFIADEIDTLEVQVATEQDEDYEPDEASCSENGRARGVEFHLTSSGDECAEMDETKSSHVQSSPQIGTQKSTPLSTVNSHILQNACALPNSSNENFIGIPRTLRKRKRKEDPGQESTTSMLCIMPAVKAITVEEKKLRGLKNLGNSCFMNSVLQALNSVQMFRYFICSLPPLEVDDVVGGGVETRTPRYNTRSSMPLLTADKRSAQAFISEELRKTLNEIGSGTGACGGAVNAFGPEGLLMEFCKVAPRFRGFQQHDAHEFLRCLLDRMHVELKSCRIPDWLLSEICDGGVRLGTRSHFLTSKRRSRMSGCEKACAISAMFEGTLQSQVTCLSCSACSNKHDPFLDLSLDIYVPSSGSRAGTVRLVDCMRRFFAKEELDSREQYTCNNCEEKRPSTKQLFVKTLPNILCLHLKRFRWSNSSHRGKLDNMVDFPLTALDMKSFMIHEERDAAVTNSTSDSGSMTTERRSNSCSSCLSSNGSNDDCNTIYDLSSLVVHHGSGVSSGHYTCYGRHGNHWYHFNDSSVKSCSEQSVAKQKAYILFYMRRNRL
uniref:Ubiquitin carboxyl-terminal hydrolase n=1 Tax=Parascaris univalens TaxID=6257 RepID=A0A915BQ31_PARUN